MDLLFLFEMVLKLFKIYFLIYLKFKVSLMNIEWWLKRQINGRLSLDTYNFSKVIYLKG